MSRVKEFLIGETELIEKEFPKVEFGELSLMVWNLIGFFGEKYKKLNEVDKFDFLVDSISQGYIDESWEELKESL
ncbi:hypothetical protein UT300003_32180 [Clostridium sardiniense]